jgi:hypothetical protein
MPSAPSFLIVSNVQYRLSESGGGRLIRSQPAHFDSVSFNPGAGATTGWERILERTRCNAEAHSLMSRYFSF